MNVGQNINCNKNIKSQPWEIANLKDQIILAILVNKYNVGTIKDYLIMLIHCEKAETFCHYGKMYLNIKKIKFESEIKYIVMFIINMLEYSNRNK